MPETSRDLNDKVKAPYPKASKKSAWLWIGWAAGFLLAGVVCAMAVIWAAGQLLNSKTQPTNTAPTINLASEAPAQEPTTQFFSDVPMALIHTGEFHMGSENGGSDEKPAHTVYLDAYYIDVYEVTNARYAECVAAGGCMPPHFNSSYTRNNYYGNLLYNDYPVIFVDWFQAQAYCQWRGGDLPTEAQWEKAARGGFEGMTYPWGDQAPDCDRANFGGKSGCVGDTTKVGSYAPNGYGLHDMAGNVWEWVLDWYSTAFYSSSPLNNPIGPSAGDYRVLRGGSWDFDDFILRVANRYWFIPAYGGSNDGFRCARLP